MIDDELSEEEVNRALPFHGNEIEQSEEMRRYKAGQLGLPSDADWEIIVSKEDEKNQRDSAKALGLDENSSWDQIVSAENGEGERVSSAILLGLPRDATYRQIVEVRRAAEFELLQKIAQEMVDNRRQG